MVASKDATIRFTLNEGNMKLKGEVLSEINRVTLVLPRGEKEIAFTFAAIMDDSEFEKLCKKPEPPMSQKPGSPPFKNFEHPSYVKALEEWTKNYTFYLWIKSMSATEGLEFEKVKLGDPTTWPLIEKELEDAGFNKTERGRMLNAALEANSLSDGSIERARKRFFARVAEETVKSTSQTAAQ
jgi:hypothetical protein